MFTHIESKDVSVSESEEVEKPKRKRGGSRKYTPRKSTRRLPEVPKETFEPHKKLPPDFNTLAISDNAHRQSGT